MNKRPNTVRNDLEDELTADITNQQAEVETGKYRKLTDPYSQLQEERQRAFNIRVGHRRRHPMSVLQQHQSMMSTTEKPESVWEQALMDDDNRTKLPEVFKQDAFKMMSTQVGLQEVASENYKKKKKQKITKKCKRSSIFRSPGCNPYF